MEGPLWIIIIGELEFKLWAMVGKKGFKKVIYKNNLIFKQLIQTLPLLVHFIHFVEYWFDMVEYL